MLMKSTPDVILNFWDPGVKAFHKPVGEIDP